MNDATIRSHFPSLQRKHNGKSLIYLDGPAGTQVPQTVIDTISNYYKTSNANTHGQFLTTHETDAHDGRCPGENGRLPRRRRASHDFFREQHDYAELLAQPCYRTGA